MSFEIPERPDVAVIGAGPAGLGALKCLQEEGFRVTGFERRDGVGGIWAFTENPNWTSVTSHTLAQLSKYSTSYTDFPFPDDYPLYPTPADFVRYFTSYAHHFHIHNRIVFGVSVKSVLRNSDDTKWLLVLEGEDEPRLFDRVVLACGAEFTPRLPEIEGMEKFEGRFLHSQAYKTPEQFEGKRVVILGQGNTACDCAVEISTLAEKTYLSHRRAAKIFPRLIKGRPFEASSNWALTRFSFWLEVRNPSLYARLFDHAFDDHTNQSFGKLDPAWRFSPAPSISQGLPVLVCNDKLVPALRRGDITSQHSIKRIAGPRSIEFEDGTVVHDIDAIIACTGYRPSFSLLGDAVTYSRIPLLGTDKVSEPKPNLYQNIFPVNHSSTIAVLNYLNALESSVLICELASMAVSQVWKGNYELPGPRYMMEELSDAQAFQAWKSQINTVTPSDGSINHYHWFRWVDEAAGTEMYTHLSPGKGMMRFAFREPKLFWTMMWGTYTPHMFRYFGPNEECTWKGRRKAWDGARGAILKVNRLRREEDTRAKKDSKGKKTLDDDDNAKEKNDLDGQDTGNKKGSNAIKGGSESGSKPV